MLHVCKLGIPAFLGSMHVDSAVFRNNEGYESWQGYSIADVLQTALHYIHI